MMTRTIAATACICLALAFAVGADDKKEEKPKGADYSNMDLNKRSFEGKVVEYASFEGSELQAANFKKALAEGAVFTGANLTGADFTGANLRGADFRKAIIDLVVLTDVDMSSANLEGADLSKCVYVKRVKLRNANLRNLKGIGKLDDISFAGADLRGADLADMNDNGFIKSNFRKARYDKSTRWPKNFDPEEAGALLVTEAPKK
jgi:uncharacterized protein YjbI with pentapeptide repeats